MKKPNETGLLSQLPSPPPGKSGWPWTEESPVLPERMEDGAEWPKISIVTPSFNQGRFIEETIRSVLLQNYPNLEYIIMDGGSTDESVEIIEKYAPWLTYWVSERDEGQSDAINKGFSIATATLAGWLNSDDLFVASALSHIAREYHAHGDGVAWAGIVKMVDIDREEIALSIPKLADEVSTTFADWGVGGHICQPGCMFLLSSYKSVNGLKDYLHYIMDVDLWVRLRRKGVFFSMNTIIAEARVYPQAKTHRYELLRESEFISLNIVNKNQAVAKTFAHKLARQYLLHLEAKQLALFVSTWGYRKLVKNPLRRLYSFMRPIFIKK